MEEKIKYRKRYIELEKINPRLERIYPLNDNDIFYKPYTDFAE